MGARFEALDEGVLAAASKSIGYFCHFNFPRSVVRGLPPSPNPGELYGVPIFMDLTKICQFPEVNWTCKVDWNNRSKHEKFD